MLKYYKIKNMLFLQILKLRKYKLINIIKLGSIYL